MDMSKLPRLSKTDRPAAASEQPNPSSDPVPVQPDSKPSQMNYGDHPLPPAGAEVWLSLVIGVILMWVGRSFALYLSATIVGRTYDTGARWTTPDRAGQPVSYFQLQGYTAYSDSAIFLFGLAMVLEGLALAHVHSRMGGKLPVLMVALVLSVAATLYNLVVAGILMSAGFTPLMSALAVAFGSYMAVYQWKLLRFLRTGAAAPMT